jgi:hypothetical protein
MVCERREGKGREGKRKRREGGWVMHFGDFYKKSTPICGLYQYYARS